MPRPSQLDLLVVGFLGEEDLEVAIEVGVRLLDPLQIEGLPLLAQLPVILLVLLVKAAVAALPHLHQLHQILEVVVLVLLLFDDGQLHFFGLARMRVLLEEVVDHGLGAVDVAAAVPSVGAVLVIAEDVGVKASLGEVEGGTDALLFGLWRSLHVLGRHSFEDLEVDRAEVDGIVVLYLHILEPYFLLQITGPELA